jgi:clan AA aspartic protease (TIGR02281 family)
MNSKYASRFVTVAALCAVLNSGRLAISAEDPATPAAAAPGTDVFKDKGLVVVGNRLVLPVEAEVHDQVKQMRIAQAKATAEANSRKSVDADVIKTKETIKAMEAEYARLNDLLASTADPAQQNQIIGRTNSITSQQKTQQSNLESLISKQKELTASKEAYIELMGDVSKNIDADEHAYDDLAKDADVASAIAEYNKTAKIKVTLGPTSEYTANLKLIRLAMKDVSTEVVPVSTDHGVPEVDVVLNGKTKQAMVWDSGASSVVINTELAASLGLHPGPKDPIVKCKLADGHIVACHQMTLKSVSVGAFTVNDVECMVMPPDIKDGDPLLGDSFQSHFLTKLDQGGGTLRLTPVDNTSVSKHTANKGVGSPKAAKE